eukprot:1776700-Pyramimonas_sp.AAC.1
MQRELGVRVNSNIVDESWVHTGLHTPHAPPHASSPLGCSSNNKRGVTQGLVWPGRINTHGGDRGPWKIARNSKTVETQ